MIFCGLEGMAKTWIQMIKILLWNLVTEENKWGNLFGHKGQFVAPNHLISYLFGFGSCESKKIGTDRLESIPQAFCSPIQYFSDQASYPSSVFTRKRTEVRQGSFILLLAKQTSHYSLENKSVSEGNRCEFFWAFKELNGELKKKEGCGGGFHKM